MWGCVERDAAVLIDQGGVYGIMRETGMDQGCQTLKIEGNELRESNGTLVAKLSDGLGSRAETYGRLFSYAVEMERLLEQLLSQQVDEFEQQLKSSFGAVPFTGVTRCGPDKLYTTLPELVQTGLILIAKIKGD